MQQNRINDAWNFIGGWYIDPSICEMMVQDFENKKSVRKIGAPERGYNYLSTPDCDPGVMNAYEVEIHRVLDEYIKLYKYAKETISPFQLETPYNIQKYEPNMHYSVWHCENNGNPPYNKRHLGFLTYLNTVTDAGETEFLYQNVKIRPEAGLTLIWPAGFTHIHRGCPSPTQEKYMVTGWFEYFDTDSFLSNALDVGDEDFWTMMNKLNRNVT